MNIRQINAAAEGWGLFETNEGLRVQKDDESGRFASDDHVLEVLQDQAATGDGLSATALAHHYASIAGLDIAEPDDWKLKHSARYILDDANPEKLAEACGLPLGVIVEAIKNIRTPEDP